MTPTPAAPTKSLRRTAAVWGVFVTACALAIGTLSLTSGATRTAFERTGATHSLSERMPSARTAPGALRTASISPRFAQLDRQRWHGIVIHHSGTPAGDATSLERKHVQDGLTGLGYHFIIGNGQGLDDGQVEVGYRWDRQLAGAHVAQTAGALRPAAYYNEHAIAICLVGNGDRRPFTERQLHELVGLIRQLQAELGISASEVALHSSISGVASPGQFFPVSEVFSQILP